MVFADSGIIGVVYATNYEVNILRTLNNLMPNPKRWGSAIGHIKVVGHFADMPVCASMEVVEIDEHRVLFVEGVSAVVDHRLIKSWLEDNLPQTAFRDGNLKLTSAKDFDDVYLCWT